MKARVSLTTNSITRSPLRYGLFLTAFVLVLLEGVLDRSANAAFPGQNGKIAFHRVVGRFAIFTINPDGSGLTMLTSTLSNNENPAWSADGSKIVFMSDRDGNFEIYSMNADGSGQTRLTNNTSADEFPGWSPDGTKIVFTSNRDGNFEIYSMNADGSGQTRLTNNPASDFAPAWSPDGTKIAFDSTRDGNDEIYTMNSDGSNPVRLTNNPASDTDPNWSPDGTKLVFHGNSEIYSMNADGSDLTNLSQNPAFDADPAWSPDGSMITFTTNRNGLFQISVMNADGSGQTAISAGSGLEGFPDWQPTVSSALELISAASRKTHGTKGAFDIDLPLTGHLGIECRTGLTRYTIVFTFNNDVTGADSATSSCGTVSSIAVDPANSHNLLVSFNGATCDAQTVNVTLTNVHDSLGNTLGSASASVGILVGDVLGAGHVGNGDIGNVQGHLGEQTDSSNFRDDVTVDGRINIQDVQTVRSYRGTSLP
jgi:WD40-like Beta Propeller Repeat